MLTNEEVSSRGIQEEIADHAETLLELRYGGGDEEEAVYDVTKTNQQSLARALMVQDVNEAMMPAKCW
jgi:hypothetical protein